MKADNNYTFAIGVSVVLHLLLVIALIFGSDFSLDDKAKPNTIQAVVIDPGTIAKQANQIRQERERAERAEQERLKKLKQQAAQLEKNRKAEEERIRRLKEKQVQEKKAARQAEEERKKAVAEAKKEKERAVAAEAERKRKADAAAKAEAAKAEAERKAKAEAERVAKAKAAEKARKEKAARAEAERKQKEAALNDIFAGLEDETVQNSSAKQQHIDNEVNRHAAIYTQMIQQNLLVDETYVGKSCRVKIKLASSGLLLSVTTLGGDAQVCRAAKTAVTKVNVFPMPKDADVVAKLTNINLTVQPE
ncbi:cell envelope integrity protein TolA [Aliivibrio fischeri]|uniref:cell envelope integrity protein TolA n=1 Tax=Aliivibrio fischeri TaxID=668 RepID=UPI0007C56630|nr:cell envelope integrity protein TolA [Aliivibrio fischeri]MBP3141512.1 cell envelope integrity protein TolA [Aliivibrio fischeri]MBP3157868.1 cell envelope integrity protein TolA [Aliivibrio fischeri]MCE7572497.1 cell envelope integrity protein TolA [Aliivibrio fischeri]